MMKIIKVKLNKKNILALFIICLSGLALLFGFQNCSKASLQKILPSEKAYEAPLLNLKSEMCGYAQQIGSASSKIVFVIDMSRSNFGSFEQDSTGWHFFEKFGSDTDPAFGITTLDSKSMANRFTAALDFLDTCGSAAGNNFKVIGFSKSSGVVVSETVGGITKTSLKCDFPTYRQFESAASTKVALQALFARQQFERSLYDIYKPGGRTWDGILKTDDMLMSDTSYPSAMKCLQDTILDDLDSVTSFSNNYHVFFITDGKPLEDLKNKDGVCYSNDSAIPESCYLSKSLESLTLVKTAALMKGRTLTLHGVYYNALEPIIPNVLTQISQEGGAPSVLQFNGFKDPNSGLCKLTQSKSSLELKPDNFGVVALTLFRKNGKIKVDSDMDGLPDDEDSNSTNPRSMGVPILDGICLSLGGAAECKNRYDKISLTCDSNKYYGGYPLNDCELKILGLDLLAIKNGVDQGLDSDLDGIPDFVEIIKGLNPAMADSKLDPDGDGISNSDEIMAGRDPFVADNDIPEYLLNNASVKFNSQPSAACPNGAWELSLSRTQVGKTFAYEGNGTMDAKFQHAANENVFLVYFRQVPQNSLKAAMEYRAKIVKVNYSVSKKIESVLADKSFISSDDFDLMGKAGK
ncbi:MAG: hypothetical protein WA160_16835 [Pseudobdellovibrio sp.]